MRRVDWNLVEVKGHQIFTSSRLAWGVWIEIDKTQNHHVCRRSRLAWGVWIEILSSASANIPRASRLAWGVWIEISEVTFLYFIANVTPRMRRVDWNLFTILLLIIKLVTPRMRHVDWNIVPQVWHTDFVKSRLVWGVTEPEKHRQVHPFATAKCV